MSEIQEKYEAVNKENEQNNQTSQNKIKAKDRQVQELKKGRGDFVSGILLNYVQFWNDSISISPNNNTYPFYHSLTKELQRHIEKEQSKAIAEVVVPAPVEALNDHNDIPIDTNYLKHIVIR